MDHKWFKDDEGNLNLPPGITWRRLKNSRRIAEFCSEMSRAMGLEHLDITLDTNDDFRLYSFAPVSEYGEKYPGRTDIFMGVGIKE